jgi:hypothetical protein
MQNFNDFRPIPEICGTYYPGSKDLHTMDEMINTYVNAALVLQEYTNLLIRMGLCHSKSTLIWPGRITRSPYL